MRAAAKILIKVTTWKQPLFGEPAQPWTTPRSICDFLKKKNNSLAFQPLTPSSHSMSWLFAAILTPKVMEVSSPLKTKRKNDENIK
jgi:hypothetical protein